MCGLDLLCMLVDQGRGVLSFDQLYAEREGQMTYNLLVLWSFQAL